MPANSQVTISANDLLVFTHDRALPAGLEGFLSISEVPPRVLQDTSQDTPKDVPRAPEEAPKEPKEVPIVS